MSLNLVAPLNGLGYGVVGYNVLKALIEMGEDVSYWPIGRAEWDSPAPFVQKAIERAKTYNDMGPSVRIWHQNDMAMMPGDGQRFAFSIFELDTLSPVERHHLGSVDGNLVCSKWAAQVLMDNDVDDQANVIPLGVDPKVFFIDEAAVSQRKYWTHNKTVFLNAGKWEVRKGHNELLEAFCKAFKPEDDVELWMLNNNPFIGSENEQWKMKYMSSEMAPCIKILPRIKTRSEMRQLYNTVDFGVFPSHAEGWNLEALELMACGKTSIITNYSGHTEFCDESNSLLVQPNGMEPARDGRWFKGEGNWCTFGIEELVSQMRVAHEMRQSQSTKLLDLQRNAKATANGLSWANTAQEILQVLEPSRMRVAV
jgi:glycosyltransferase involved in cell wall biosynthesis